MRAVPGGDGMARVRPNQNSLTQAQWSAFVGAVNATHGIGVRAPAYRDFVALHVKAMSMGGMPWGVHFMGPGTSGRNFLAWHRRFLQQFELRLQAADSSMRLPYWDWVNDRKIPTALNSPKLLKQWGVIRHWDATLLPTSQQIDAVTALMDFTAFQLSLEKQHDQVHIAVGGKGGTMDTASSPADPLFWLHHSNIDRIWWQWQTQHLGADPPSPNEPLEEAPIMGVPVATQLDIAKLGYSFG